MKNFKFISLLFSTVFLFACGSKNENTEPKKEEPLSMTYEIRSFNCTFYKLKECFEKYLDKDLSSQEVDVLEETFKTYTSLHLRDKINLESTILALKLEFNRYLFNVEFDDKDFEDLDLFKLARLAELEQIVTQIIMD